MVSIGKVRFIQKKSKKNNLGTVYLTDGTRKKGDTTYLNSLINPPIYFYHITNVRLRNDIKLDDFK